MWNLNVDDAIQRICAATSNILTPAQWKRYLPQQPYSLRFNLWDSALREPYA
jgi:hypothetical protein